MLSRVSRQVAKVGLTRVSSIAARPVTWKEASYAGGQLAVRRSYATEGSGSSQQMIDFMFRLQKNPEIIEQLKRINELMVTKNLIPKPEEMVDENGNMKKLTMMQQMKIFMDTDVRGAVNELGQMMTKSGLELTPEDIKMLTQFMQQNTLKQKTEDTDGDGSK
ncbi:DEKNAAC100193 [Brettanomyces naardenensis]|uniref:DEKNAAC100193 n=1 Tax=Brettanomyces naardenensis TaxID=13370 RepID=A0A448YFZ8_BRENA|nr:DEKNAAC100193 [Brettanomyces naardenensis]